MAPIRRLRLPVLATSTALLVASCTSPFWQGFLGSSGYERQTLSVGEVRLTGADGTDLGCLSCSSWSDDSVFNSHGSHGTTSHRASVLNPDGPFGSSTSAWSACNPSASDPPRIQDALGGGLGRLTLNEAHPDATRDAFLLTWLRETVCA